MSRIVIIDGHPDTGEEHYVHALADAYAEAALDGGHEVRRIKVAALEFPLIRSEAEWSRGAPPPDIEEAQKTFAWAEHVVFLYPLWLGDVPALLKGFLEQLNRPGFAFAYQEKGLPKKLMTGRSARIIVTMGMPAIFYSLFYRAHSLKSLERNVLKFTGFGPVRHSVIGTVAGRPENRRKWLERVRKLGARAA